MKHLFFFLNSIFITLVSPIPAQQGQWTWMKGDTVFVQGGTYGTKGTAGIDNRPGSRYEPVEWTDTAGNFWLFGGSDVNASVNNDLWKYDPRPSSPGYNMWTWVNGDQGGGAQGIYLTKGFPSSTNKPGARSYGATSWTDASNNLWLFGGFGYDGYGNFGDLNDLWKYDISTNQWTWMSGEDIADQIGIYGKKGIENATNMPASRDETAASWTDNFGNLWLFGGIYEPDPETDSSYLAAISYRIGYLNDLWKYNAATNQWTWMHGDSIANQTGKYGVKGEPSPANKPGGRGVYAKWKDACGGLCMYGGYGSYGSEVYGYFNDLWKYDISSDRWIWISGDSIADTPYMYGTKCTSALTNNIKGTYENRACWTDSKYNLYAVGGGRFDTLCYNSLWKYDPAIDEWTWISGDNTVNSKPVYGAQGVSSVANKPEACRGSVGWKDRSGNFWLFGGVRSDGWGNGVLWKFTPDTTCSNTGTPASPSGTLFSADATSGCIPLTINFTNQHLLNAHSQWDFGDGQNSTLKNPDHMYSYAGTYTIGLTANDAFSCKNITTTLQIKIIDCDTLMNIIVPNIFTPNGDGVNDLLTIHSTGKGKISGEIFNRWGNKIYELNETSTAWNGNTAGGTTAPEGVYYYVIKTTSYEETKTYKDFFQLVRK